MRCAVQLVQHPIYFVPFALVLLAASGIGRLMLRSSVRAGPAREAVANTIVGVLVLLACFTLAMELGAPFEAASVALGVIAAIGLTAWGVDVVLRPKGRRERLLVPAAGLGLLMAASWLPVNMGAADPPNYAYVTSTALERVWVNQNVVTGPVPGLVGINTETTVSRASSIGVLWPWAALGWAISPAMVAEAAQWLLLGTLVLLVDVLDGWAPLPGRLLLAAGGLGAFNEETVLGNGQIGQSFAIAAAVAGIWLASNLRSGWARLLMLGVVGYTATAGYTEIVVVLPLYVGCLCVLRPRGWRDALSVAGALLLGVLAADLATRGETLQYFLHQSTTSPNDWPLPTNPDSVLDVWQWMLLGRAFPRLLTLLLLPVAVYAVWLARFIQPPGRRFTSLDGAVLGGAVVLLGFLTWATLRSGNVNYATFKVSGWVGPMLLVGGWALVALVGGRIRQIASVGLLLLAGFRTLGLLWAAGSLTVAYWASMGQAPGWSLTSEGGTCTVESADVTPAAWEIAIAESAAPQHGCTLGGA